MGNKKQFAGCVAMMLVVSAIAYAQGTEFTYQGKLMDGGNVANGSYDMQFKLYDTVNTGTGTQQGSTLTMANIAVSSGIFSVQLDFGACATCFDGNARYLEIAVKKTSDSSYTTLSPRQPVTSTPYAIRSMNATMADGLSVACINCVTSGQIQSVSGSAVTGTIPVASVPDLGASYIKNTTSQQATSNFNISGTGTAVTFNATTQYNISGNRVLSVPGTNNLFAGSGSGQSNTSGAGNAFVGAGAGQANTVGANNAFFGFNAGRNNVGDIFGNGSDNSIFGSQAGQSNTGGQNSFFGRAAGLANQIGSFNSFFGSGAGQGSTGNFNSFFGASAGVNNTADGNSFFGVSAGLANTTGTGNSFFGYHAGMSNNTEANNTFIGAGARNPDATKPVNDLTALGANALASGCLTFAGFTGEAVALGSGANANCLSTAVGKGATASGIASIAVGDGAIASGLGSIAIGTGVSVSSNNTIVIGPSHGSTVIVPGAMNIGSGVETVGTAVLVVNGGLVFNTSGFLGVGTLSPAQQLDVNGQARIESIPPGPSAAAVCFNSAGDLLQCGGSSLRWKRNIHPFTSGLGILLRLRPISFNWKESGLPDIGLGAEEVAQVAPSFTFTNSKGEIAGVKYERLNILLINAIKEQQQQIEQAQASAQQQQTQINQQQAQINQQQTQIKRQQKEIDALKKLLCLDHPDTEICKTQTKPR
ncbi:MAG TPA: tail fiber domain-containing protein [Blastocatellia bacterium]|nr:tail fiber domain-containing protein [Blastocatellia bacterium]